MGVWTNKEQMAVKAVEHTNLMESMYHDEIMECVKRSVIYNEHDCFENLRDPNPNQEVIVLDTDSVDAAFKEGEVKTCILNFASYKNPGCMFIKGSSAQEECLCHESFLYNVLCEFKEIYYNRNTKDTNRSLYRNRAIYSPDVEFMIKIPICDRESKFDILTCAAPNFRAASKYCGVSKEDNETVFEERIKFVLDILDGNKCDTIILGAFGCGVFGQDAVVAANIFSKLIPMYGFKKVVFAIPNYTSYNHRAFERKFS